MLAGGTGQTVSTLKSLGSFHSQVPVVRCSRSTDGHAPCTLSAAEGVLEEHNDLPAQPGVPQILQFNGDSHLMGILSKPRSAHRRCKPVKYAQGGCSSSS